MFPSLSTSTVPFAVGIFTFPSLSTVMSSVGVTVIVPFAVGISTVSPVVVGIVNYPSSWPIVTSPAGVTVIFPFPVGIVTSPPG